MVRGMNSRRQPRRFVILLGRPCEIHTSQIGLMERPAPIGVTVDGWWRNSAASSFSGSVPRIQESSGAFRFSRRRRRRAILRQPPLDPRDGALQHSHDAKSHAKTVPCEGSSRGGGQKLEAPASTLRHSRAPSRESRDRRAQFASAAEGASGRRRGCCPWILGTGPENDEAARFRRPLQR